MEKEAQYEQKRRRRAIQEASYATSGILLDGTPSQYLQAQVETDEINLDRQDQASYARQMNILYKGQSERANLLAQADAYKSSASRYLQSSGRSSADINMYNERRFSKCL